MSYVYIRSEPQLWTTGFYRPDGKWESESDHASPEAAAKRCHWLNGGADLGAIEEIAGHLGAALTQCSPSDDAIIIGHIQGAYAEASRILGERRS